METSPYILSASPRRGNSYFAAEVFASTLSAAGHPAAVRELRKFRVNPCVSCGACNKEGAECPQGVSDESHRLFKYFLAAPVICIAAPIYFYHLPAQLKTLIDRCQLYYTACERGDLSYLQLPRRKAFVMLTAAREKGENLFTGSIMTLKLALAPFNIHMVEPLLLRGLDGTYDLAVRSDYQSTIKNYAMAAAAELSKE